VLFVSKVFGAGFVWEQDRDIIVGKPRRLEVFDDLFGMTGVVT
jgi:hypothetical protein